MVLHRPFDPAALIRTCLCTRALDYFSAPSLLNRSLMSDKNSHWYRKCGIASVILNAYLLAFWALAATGLADRFSKMIPFEVPVGRILALPVPVVFAFS